MNLFERRLWLYLAFGARNCRGFDVQFFVLAIKAYSSDNLRYYEALPTMHPHVLCSRWRDL